MKTILVAIDFSKNATHALRYALLFANKLQTNIHLVWVDNTTSDESVTDTIEGELRREKKAYMKKIIEDYQPMLEQGKIDVIFRKGRIYQEVNKVAREIKAEMIFTGTHGVSGYEQYWIGSNAYRIMTQAPCPMITIRCDFEFDKTIKNILLPLDSSLETKQKLPFACNLAKGFGSVIHLLEVYNTPIKVIRKRINQFGQEAKKSLTKEKVNFKLEKIEAGNVAASILNYSNDHNIDLIMMMTEQGTTTANKYLGPYAQQLINNSKVPVLSLRAKEYR
ncbi:MAG: universal stress protein [Bacteroidales bacterium]|nr:universal stress protein [Bacteroidales bacterium]MCF6341324.1 universal stress protein [Bacteroidales bacterium]